jgi:hypothetical protein
MRVYHRLIHIRDQKERHEDIPESITSHPVFKLTTQFRLHVQQKSAPISKTSKLIVTEEGMQIFGQLAEVLSEQGSRVMVYLVACLLERLFGTDTIDDIEGIRGDLSISDIIDGVTSHGDIQEVLEDGDLELGDEVADDEDLEGDVEANETEYAAPQFTAPTPLRSSTTEWPSSNFTQPSSALPTTSSVFANVPRPAPVTAGAFAGLVSTPNVFGTQSVFGTSVFPSATANAPSSSFGISPAPGQSVFGPPGVATSAAATSLNQPPSPPQAFSPAPVPLFEKPKDSFLKAAAPGSPSNVFGMRSRFNFYILLITAFRPKTHTSTCSSGSTNE